MTILNHVFINSIILAPCGCVMVAGGLSVLATEFPAAQRVLDNGKEKLRNFADEKDEEEKDSEDDIDGIDSDKTELLDFELIEEDGSSVTKDISSENTNNTNTFTDNKRALFVETKQQKSGSSRNEMKESLRQLTKNRILPLIDRLSKQKVEDDTTGLE